MTIGNSGNAGRDRKSPQVQVPSLEKSIIEEQQRQLESFKPLDSSLPSDKIQHDISDIASNKKNFDQKIYLFPESYNQLRKELVENWPDLWKMVQWSMAFKAEDFVESMNAALDLKIQFDTGKVSAICGTYLDILRVKRGVSTLWNGQNE